MTNGEPSILTRSGNYFNFLDPEHSSYDIYDIAHGLSNICRFGGQCNKFYSVAQHSVLASRFIANKFKYDALMHDSQEAFLCDIPKPLKNLLPDYQKIEERVERALFAKFGVSYPLPPEIKQIDLIMLATEQKCLMPKHDDEWLSLAGIKPLDFIIVPWSPEYAFKEFIKTYQFLRTNKLVTDKLETNLEPLNYEDYEVS